MLSDDELQGAVAERYRALATALSPLHEDQWATPSLCEGWRVREVIAHATMPARYDDAAFMEALRARDFDFGRLSDDVAERDGTLPIEQLVRDLRSAQLHRWAPSHGGTMGALSHAVIHGLDVTVPLGIDDGTPGDVLRVLLDQMTGGGAHGHFGVQIEGRRLEATDLDWSWGDGPTLRGAAGDLLLTLAGRTLPAGRLEGRPL